MEKKKNILIIILVIVIAILCLIIGWLLGSKFADTENGSLGDSNSNIEENNSVENEQIDTKLENNSIELKNYNIDEIKNIEVSIPVKDLSDPEMKNITIENKEEIKNILLNVDNAREVGKIPEGIGFEFSSSIKINYEGDPSTVIVLLSNGNLAINFAYGVGETGFGEYEINNKNFEVELIDKYQN